MSSEICFICATDEGIFLDIFTNDKALRNNIETCLSLKLYKSKVASHKICHKCAFELDKCSRFVGNCKSTKRPTQAAARQRVRCCSLCLEPGKPGYIHNLHVETSKNALNKIQDIFHNGITLTESSTSICLECRYNLDVLTDLKKIYQATSSSSFQSVFNGEVDITKLPKIETEVVKRKTTYVPLSKLQVVSCEVDSEPPPASSTRNKNKSMDVEVKSPSLRTTKSQKGKQLNSSNDTKKCSVFLKDISSTLTEIKSKDSINLRSSNNDNVEAYISLVSDDSDDGDESPSKSPTITNIRKNSKRSFSDPENKISVKKVKKEKDEILLTKRRTRADQSSPVLSRTRRRVSETATSEVKVESKSRSKRSIKLASPNREVKKPLRNRGKFISAAKKLSSSSSADDVDDDDESEEEPKTKRQLRNKSRSKNISQKISTKSESCDEGNQPYTCTVCSLNFDNRLDGMTHELTHSKMLGVVLEKVPVPKPAETKEKQQKVTFDVPQSDEENVEKLDENIDEEASSSLQDDSLTEKVNENTENVSENLETLEEETNKNIPEVDGKDEEAKGDEESLEENIPSENQETLDQPESNSVGQDSIDNSENSKEEAEKSKETVDSTESFENKETMEIGEEEKSKEPEENEETDSIDGRNLEELMKKIHEGQSPDRRTIEPEVVKSNNLAEDLASSASEMENSELSQMSVEKVGEDPPCYESITPPVTFLDENTEKPAAEENDESCEAPTIEQSQNDESRCVVDDTVAEGEKINNSNKDEESLNDVDKESEKLSKNAEKEIEAEENNCVKAQINNDNDKNEKKSQDKDSEIPLDMSPKKNSEHKIHEIENIADDIEKTNTDKIPLTQPTIDELEDKLSGC